MDNFDPDELEVKRILVDLEDEHQHLKVSIGHLEHEIQKREVEVQRLLADRELDLAKSRNQDKPLVEAEQRQDKIQFSSDFAEEVAFLLDRIQRTSEQVCELVKLLDVSETLTFDYAKWARSQLPVTFLKQQIYLVALVGASFLLFVLTRLFTSNIHHTIDNLSSELNYGVIVDCGSSGSRAHIYSWKQDPIASPIELVRDRHEDKPLSKHITPGLSSLKDDPDKASDYMEPIMNFISEAIPQDRHLDTPVYFLATAGLRLLEDSTQKRILADITRDLRAKFDFPRIKSQVISGAYEGVYSWLSLNMHQKLYNTSHDSKSYGMIEIGGASAQITFELNPQVENAILKDLKSVDAISAFKSEQVTLNLGHRRSVKLFATTFLGLGVNSAREASVDLLVRDYLHETNGTDLSRSDLSQYEARLKDPCLTIGSSEIVLRPTILLRASSKSIGFVIKENEETFKVRLEGTGEFSRCMILLERTLQLAKQERLNCGSRRQPCSMALLGTKFVPFNSYPFMGLSELYFTTHEMMNLDGPFDREKVLQATEKICGSQYNSLLDDYSQTGITLKDRILYECFKASWLLTLLHDNGFNMPTSYDNLRTVDRLDGKEIDWTVGAIIKEVALSKLSEDLKQL